MNITQLATINTNELFDSLTALKPAQAVDILAKLEQVQKNLKETLDEVKTWLANSLEDDSKSIDGEYYQLTVTTTSNEKSTYDPNLIFQKLRTLSPEIQKSFLEIVQVSIKAKKVL
jgi:hypothetical protein